MLFDIIVAFDHKRGIGSNNLLPWNLSNDLHRFKTITTNNIIIMGKNTWNSLPKKPLPNRINIIISSTLTDNNADYIFKTFEESLEYIKNNNNYKQKHIYVIGGSKLYETAINHSLCDKIYTTEIYNTFDCDVFFPNLPNKFKPIDASTFFFENNLHFRYITYSQFNWKVTVNHEEDNYLKLLYKIIDYGEKKHDRTNVGTHSLFGEMLTYNLTETFPILTTRKQFFRGIFEELMFYIRGQTNNDLLVDKGINIWTKNTTRDFLNKRGLHHLPEGDMGSTYGFNFRHFGGEYIDCRTEYKDIGFDQLTELIKTLKTEPNSRRLIITLWDPRNNKNAALPSCLCWYQFYISNDTYLNLQIYIRSSDYFLANNWNTCTGALLVHLICNTNGLTHYKPGVLKVVMGDTHVYNNHIDKAQEIRNREPKAFPKLIIKNTKNDITKFEWEDIQLIGYKYHPSVKVDMAI
tara:strand:+ start:376 stop:1764 length:1389 start_codon:yes stop_codon:yes gene_type:complete